MPALIIHYTLLFSPFNLLTIIDTPSNRATLPALIIHYSSFIIHYFSHLLTIIDTKTISSCAPRSHYSIFIIESAPFNLIIISDFHSLRF